jgi:hypothetical protein
MGVSAAIVVSVVTGYALAAEKIALPGTPYSITLPGSPKCDTEAAEVPSLGMDFPAECRVEVGGLKYTFDYMVLPFKVRSDQAEGAMFANALGRAAAMGCNIAEKQLSSVAGFQSLDFAITDEDRGVVGYGRYVIVRTHLVRAVVEATEGSLARESVDDVLNSLVLE